MIKVLLTTILLFVLLLVQTGHAQTFTIVNGGNVSTCSGDFYDTGGLLGDYQNNQDITYTICSSTPGSQVSIQFTSFSTENNFDFLEIHDGNSVASPSIGIYTGVNSPGIVVSTNGCLTFHFTSDVSLVGAGWVASISCTSCGCLTATPPANDACANAQNLGTLPMPVNCDPFDPNSGMGTPVTISGSNNCATAENPYIFQTNCNPGTMANPAASVWYTFNVVAPTLNIFLSSSLSQANIGLYTSTCGSFQSVGCDVSSNGNISTSFTGLASGTYYLQVSGGSLIDQCDFALNISNDFDCNLCVFANTFTATPPPVNGTYTPGDTVTFCYTITDFNAANDNWLHGVVPTFGSGWDLSTLITFPSGSCDGFGSWAWYPNPVISTNTGIAHGPGFFYESIKEFINQPLDADPGNNWGDFNLIDTCEWAFCWSIVTKPGNLVH